MKIDTIVTIPQLSQPSATCADLADILASPFPFVTASVGAGDATSLTSAEGSLFAQLLQTIARPESDVETPVCPAPAGVRKSTRPAPGDFEALWNPASAPVELEVEADDSTQAGLAGRRAGKRSGIPNELAPIVVLPTVTTAIPFEHFNTRIEPHGFVPATAAPQPISVNLVTRPSASTGNVVPADLAVPQTHLVAPDEGISQTPLGVAAGKPENASSDQAGDKLSPAEASHSPVSADWAPQQSVSESTFESPELAGESAVSSSVLEGLTRTPVPARPSVETDQDITSPGSGFEIGDRYHGGMELVLLPGNTSDSAETAVPANGDPDAVEPNADEAVQDDWTGLAPLESRGARFAERLNDFQRAGDAIPIHSFSDRLEEIAIRLERIETAEPTSLILRLEPRELGQVHVHLSLVEDAVSIRMVATNEAARQAIEQQLNELHHSLSDHGVRLDQCHVECGQSGNQSFDRTAWRQDMDEPAGLFQTGRRQSVVAAGGCEAPGPRTQLDYVA